jgi:hypothetical protein
MKTSPDQLRTIYERTNGTCHLCHKKVAPKNYGILNARGAWEIDHSLAKANGGTDHGNNCLPAHIRCNRAKQARASHVVRRQYGTVGVPHSKTQIEKIRQRNGGIGAVVCGAVGLLGGPLVAAAASFLGYQIGKTVSVSKA